MYQIRWWQQPDLPWLHQAAAAGAWESLSDEERAGTPAPVVAELAQQQMMSVLGSGWGSALVAQAPGGRPVGFLLMTLGPDASTEETHGMVLSVWVAPEHRRRGIARSLQSTAEQVFGQMGMRKVKVWSGVHNQAALNLAVKNGYVPEGLIGMKSF
jgi:ribosomal protein S18 acetylase RimI-like enzyme